eukprot:gene4124-5160_t
MELDYIIPYTTNKCPFWLSWSPDNLNISICTNDSVDIFESNSGELLYSFKDHSQVVSMLAWLNRSHTSFIDDEYSSSNSRKEKLSKDQISNTSKSSYNNSLANRSEYHSFVSCSLDSTIKLYQNYKLKLTLTDHKDWLKSITISNDDQLMLSGCASSSICGWDLETGIVKFRIGQAHPPLGDTALNTINSLKFHHHDTNIFASGSRYGSWSIWDTRTDLQKPLIQVDAHNKLNTLHFTYDDQKLLSSGRDGSLKLWDIRMASKFSKDLKKCLIREYKGHKCTGYNIGCSFVNNDRQIVSGSEDHLLYIYDTETGRILKRSTIRHPAAVHLISPTNSQNDLRIATCEIESYNLPPSTNSSNPEFLSIFKNMEEEFVKEIELEVKKLGKKLQSLDESNLSKFINEEITPQEFEQLFFSDTELENNIHIYDFDDNNIVVDNNQQHQFQQQKDEEEEEEIENDKS